MKYYVYEVVINHPRLGNMFYVGRAKQPHTPGVNYWGSCKYPQYKYWLQKFPKRCRILAEFDNEYDQLKEEKNQIIRCLHEHGAYLFGTYTLSGTIRRSWLDEFGKGTCLNGHWGSENGRSGLTKESYRSAVKIRINRGEDVIGRLVRSSHTEEVCAKRNKTKLLLNQYKNWQQASCTKEAVFKQSSTRRANAVKFKVVCPGGIIKIGCQQEIFEFIADRIGEHWTAPLYKYCAKRVWCPSKGKIKGYKIEKLND